MAYYCASGGGHNIAGVMPALGCDERARLLNEYNSATMAFSASVAELVQKAGTTLQGEYNRLKNAADQARIAAEQARLNLEKHIAEHGCEHDDDSK